MPRAQGCAGAAIATLAALVPKPRVNLTRFHGVFAPNSKHRIHVTPAKRGKGHKAQTDKAWRDKTPTERHVAMTWMQRPKKGCLILTSVSVRSAKAQSRSLPA